MEGSNCANGQEGRTVCRRANTAEKGDRNIARRIEGSEGSPGMVRRGSRSHLELLLNMLGWILHIAAKVLNRAAISESTESGVVRDRWRKIA